MGLTLAEGIVMFIFNKNGIIYGVEYSAAVVTHHVDASASSRFYPNSCSLTCMRTHAGYVN